MMRSLLPPPTEPKVRKEDHLGQEHGSLGGKLKRKKKNISLARETSLSTITNEAKPVSRAGSSRVF
jgi:hypothetical protein